MGNRSQWLVKKTAIFWIGCLKKIKTYFLKEYDTLFNVVLGIVWGIIREMCLLHTSWRDCLDLRLMGLIFDTTFSHRYSLFRKRAKDRLGIPESDRFFGKQFWFDSMLSAVFWTVIYSLNIGASYAVGLDVLHNSSLFVALGWFALGAFCAGRPYGFVLDRITQALIRFGWIEGKNGKKDHTQIPIS